MRIFQDEKIESEFQQFLDEVIFTEKRMESLLDEAVKISLESGLTAEELETDFYLSAADFFRDSYSMIKLNRMLQKSIDISEEVEDNTKRTLN